jgi:hypothetical protein
MAPQYGGVDDALSYYDPDTFWEAEDVVISPTSPPA